LLFYSIKRCKDSGFYLNSTLKSGIVFYEYLPKMLMTFGYLLNDVINLVKAYGLFANLPEVRIFAMCFS